MLTLVLGKDWKVNRKKIIELISEDVAQKKQNRILMVPETVSHQTERELAAFAGDTACRYAEVLSFSRLVNRVAASLGIAVPQCLDNGGRIVAMAAATRQLHSKLKAYAAVETKPEFLSALLEAVDEFKRCCVRSSDLLNAAKQAEGILAQKTEELAYVMEAYDSICSRSKLDPRDQMTWLLEQLENSEFAQNHVFYVDSFPDYSQQDMDILLHIIDNSPEVVISFTCDCMHSKALAYDKAADTASHIYNYAKRNGIEVQVIQTQPEDSQLLQITDSLLQGSINPGAVSPYLTVGRAGSVYDECTFVTHKVIELVQNGARYRDIRIVCSDINRYKGILTNILERAHIPAYLSGTEDVLSKSVIQALLISMDTALGGFAQKDVLRYLRSVLSPVDMDLADRMENYVITWSIDGSRWTREWEDNPRGLGEEFRENDIALLKRLNEGREKAVTPLVQLRNAFRDAVSIQQQIEALYGFLTTVQLDKKLQQLSDNMVKQDDLRAAQILNQLWSIIINALEQLYYVLAETSWDTDTFTRLFKLLLSQYDVGTIPAVLDAVHVGGLSTMRTEKSAHLFVLGAEEGVLPSYATGTGVLNDMERSALIKLGVSINPGTIEVLQSQFADIHAVFCGAEETITVTCPDGQPSYIYDRLKQMSGNEVPCEGLGAALTDSWEAAAYLVSCNGKQQAQQLGLSQAYADIDNRKEYVLGSVSREHIQSLYRGKLDLSATQIDHLASCRLSYFLQYGLSAKERKPISINPAEFGTYVHAVLEECGKKIVSMGGFKNVSLDQTLEIAADISARYFAERFSSISTDRVRYHFQKNTKELQLVVSELWKEMQETDFAPTHFELSFGDDGKMPAVQIPGAALSAQLRGFVDRVDLWQSDEQLYLRVVDYKTGEKDFDYCDVFNGIGLQMLLYLFALEDGGEVLLGENPIVAGVQYFPARIPIIKADGSMTFEEAVESRRSALKRKGLILNDEAVIYAMENAEKPVRLCCTRKKDGSLSGDIATTKQFKQLKKYVFTLLRKIVDDVASGNITPNPYTRGDKQNACQYCPYGAICHSFEVEGRRNYKTINADRFWTDVDKEV